MGQLELSPAVIGVVKHLATLDAPVFDSLKSALSQTKLTFSVDELAQQICKRVDSLNIEQAEGILRTLMSIYSTHRESKLDWEELLVSLGQSIGSTLSESELDNAMKRIRELLQSSESIQLIAKAMDVYNEHEKLFRSSRILTDIRPIFRDDNKRLSLGAAAIVHSLKIQYREGRHVNEVYIALDDSDLKALSKDIDRAKEKSEQLYGLLKSSNLPFIATSAKTED